MAAGESLKLRGGFREGEECERSVSERSRTETERDLFRVKQSILVAYYRAHWEMSSGAKGPWSPIVEAVIA
jgi:hypothetical protein